MIKTDITVVLDRSGSMRATKADTIGGFNSFVDEQRKLEGEVTLSLVQFDDVYEVIYASNNIHDVMDLNDDTYVPRGMTALVDAMGRSISDAKARIKAMPKSERPNVIFVIITDGYENYSESFKIDDVNKLISKLTKKGWQFVFIGANQDAIATAAQFGISKGNSLSYACNSLGTHALFSSVSKNVTAYRQGVKSDMSFDESDIEAQVQAGVNS